MQNRDCSTCMHDLGGGRDHCRINLTFECEAGGGYEAWEPYEDGVAAHEDEVDGQECPRVTLEDLLEDEHND